MFSSRNYDNAGFDKSLSFKETPLHAQKNSNLKDKSSCSDECFGSDELDHSAVKLFEPLSPCVTTSQFERKGSDEYFDISGQYMNSMEKLSRPAILQKTVINLDEGDTSENEEDSSETEIHVNAMCSASREEKLRMPAVNLMEKSHHINVPEKSGITSLNMNEGFSRKSACNIGSCTDYSPTTYIAAREQGCQSSNSNTSETSTDNMDESYDSDQIKGCFGTDNEPVLQGISAGQRRARPTESIRKLVKTLSDGNNSSNKVVDITNDRTQGKENDINRNVTNKLSTDWNNSDNEIVDITAENEPRFEKSFSQASKETLHCNTSIADVTSMKQECLFTTGVEQNSQRLEKSFDNENSLSKLQNLSENPLKRRRMMFSEDSHDGECKNEMWSPDKDNCLEIKNSPLDTSELGANKLKRSLAKDGKVAEELNSTVFHSLVKSNDSKKMELINPHRNLAESESEDSLEICNSPVCATDEGRNGESCNVLSYQSFADSFDDGGFNIDIPIERPPSRSSSINSSRVLPKDALSSNKEGEYSFDDGGFNCDIFQISPKHHQVEANFDLSFTAHNSTISVSRNSETIAHAKNYTSVHVSDDVKNQMPDHPNDTGSNNILLNTNNDGLDDDSLIGGMSSNSDRNAGKDGHEGTCNLANDRKSGHVAAAKTPSNMLRSFGPGCRFHPETGDVITPMSDYDALQTPTLIVSIPLFG